jgi:hypothetical protein
VKAFQIDLVYSPGHIFMTLECPDCAWMAELEAPQDLPGLNVRAEEHSEVCKGSHPE